jgi:hypothetical protein
MMFLLILGPPVHHGDLAGFPHELPLGKFNGLVILLSWGRGSLYRLVLRDHQYRGNLILIVSFLPLGENGAVKSAVLPREG